MNCMGTAIYTIQPGDTLAAIAAKMNTTLAAIFALNKGTLPEPLLPGQAILVPRIRKNLFSLGFFHVTDLVNLARTLAEFIPRPSGRLQQQISNSAAWPGSGFIRLGELFSFGAVFQFPVTAGGAIVVPEDDSVDSAVALLRSYNVLPLMVITNLTPASFDPDLAASVIGDPAVKNLLIRNISLLLERYGFAGVNVDFERVRPGDRELFTTFIRDLKSVLAFNNALVTLAVPPKNSDDPENPNAGAFDYRALGEWADFLFIMTYDWGYIGGPPMAVAPLNEVQKVLSFAAAEIPPPKIIQGIPLYGYNWQLPFGPGSRTTVVDLVSVYDLAASYQAVINYDPVAQSPNFQYTDAAGQEHVVWFEDVRSVTAKYEGARNLNLGGVGFWSGENHPYGFPQNWVRFQEMFQVFHLGPP